MGLVSDEQGMSMEFAASSKPLKTPSNISDIVSKFAKVSKFRSIGVFNTPEIPDQRHVYPIISGDSALSLETTEDVFLVTKDHQKSNELHTNGDACDHVEIKKLFDTLLELKLAYVKLQEAHIPYDPEKLKAADEEVISQLDSLYRIKQACKEKLLKEANSVSASSALLLAEIQVKEKALEKLKSQAKHKDNEAANLRLKLQEWESSNSKLAEEIKEQERERFAGLNHHSLENVVKAVGKAIHDFAKPLIALMKISDWDLDKAVNAIEESVVYAKRSHKKYAFEAYVTRRMFHGFTVQQPCYLGNIMKLDDPIVALMEDPQSSFAKFCRTKYLLVVHPSMEESFFGNLDHRKFVANGFHPCTPFYRAFVRMARCVWYLQALMAFIEPKAEIFGVKQGSEFSDIYMEVLDELKELMTLDKDQERYKVEFMIMPGFKLGETLIKSQVYVSKGTH